MLGTMFVISTEEQATFVIPTGAQRSGGNCVTHPAHHKAGLQKDENPAMHTHERFVLGDTRRVERETGIEPATNGLGSRYSTIELLPQRFDYSARFCNFAAHLSPAL